MTRLRRLLPLVCALLLAGTAGPGHAAETLAASAHRPVVDAGSFPGPSAALHSAGPSLYAPGVEHAPGGAGGPSGVRHGRAAQPTLAEPAAARSRIAALQRACLAYASDMAAARGGPTPFRGVAPPPPSRG